MRLLGIADGRGVLGGSLWINSICRGPPCLLRTPKKARIATKDAGHLQTAYLLELLGHRPHWALQ